MRPSLCEIMTSRSGTLVREYEQVKRKYRPKIEAMYEVDKERC